MTKHKKAHSSKLKAQSKPQVIATGRITGGVSETHIALRSMPSADQICSTAVRKVVRGLQHRERGA